MLKLAQKQILRFKQSQSGVAAIEFGLLLPLFIILVATIMEFGFYFTNYLISQRAVGNVSIAIQLSPGDPAIQANAYAGGLGFVNLNNPPDNYICAMSYTSQAAAQAGLCTAGMWQTSAPGGWPAGAPYYVAVVSHIKYVSTFFDIGAYLALPFFGPGGALVIPDIHSRTIAFVRPNNIPICQNPLDVLKTDGSGNIICGTAEPTLAFQCNAPGQVLQSDASGHVFCGSFTIPLCTGAHEVLRTDGGGNPICVPFLPLCNGADEVLDTDGGKAPQCRTLTKKQMIDPNSCRIVDNPGPNVWGGSVSCGPNEMLISGGGIMTAGSCGSSGLGLFSEPSEGFLHFSAPTDLNTWTVDAAKYVWTGTDLVEGDSCVAITGICCTKTDAYTP